MKGDERSFAHFILCKCRLFVRKDLELMKKSQEGKQNGKIIQQGYMVITTKTNLTHLKRTEERRQEEQHVTFLTVREQQTTRTTSGRFLFLTLYTDAGQQHDSALPVCLYIQCMALHFPWVATPASWLVAVVGRRRGLQGVHPAPLPPSPWRVPGRSGAGQLWML